ncbi:peptidase [Streptomyces mobaraensis NBRC 13819 = DSM 40847]|uniref:Uncharacterized protein n=1 Tax=Streptomyces mobaraensis (strain ATCC 29032 / DSM 40847 / JCM 4168 / NBRC 13819 / NCIMB 11159 / IPCR 16-22) TaxID=1223523 RepID=M3BYI3_STRM1|nr:DUF2268 domain-containing putative Zn-dependent protease [Streptomyces mobaraensis]EME96721.1 hypothetical protein H340_30066 [Streptomyces mobaraensis NBRC 13819 = DSM 40847]QTT72958.1 peptidase [Streptomyces mobaraensis NBRC 13819 = DSM 40847]
MQIIVHDTASATLDLLRRPPAERPDALRDLYAPLAGPMSVTGHFDPVQAHRMGSGFPLGDAGGGDDPRLPAALHRMRDAGVWQRVADSLDAAWERIDAAVPGVKHAETVHVVIVLGDPDDEHLTVRSSGYFGLGGFPGAIQLVMWPTDTSLRNIGHAAAHELHHNVRYANVTWDPAAVTVGEHVVAEGLAEAFARELAGERGLCPWTRALTGDRLDRAYERITADIDVAGMGNAFAYVLGDATARLVGQEPVGLPDFAGYGVGLRIVEAHMAATGLTAAESVALPAREILRNAGVATEA